MYAQINLIKMSEVNTGIMARKDVTQDITPSKKACHLEKVFISLLQPGFFLKKISFAALASLSARLGAMLPLPLALDHTVVLPAANQRLPATLYIAICY
jgi:hypothetical protein